MSKKIIPTVVHAVANAAAVLVSLRRELLLHHLTIDECERAGLPEGSTEKAVHCGPLHQASRWRMGAWLHAPVTTDAQGCLELRLLGCFIEVWYVRRDGDCTTAATAGALR